jgi:hypothetical protein
MRVKTAVGRILLVIGLLPPFGGAIARGDTIFVSATPGPGRDTSIGNGQIIGARFSINAPEIVEDIGGYFNGSGNIFGAIVRLSSSTDFPDSADPLSTADVLGHTLINLGLVDTDVSGTIGPVTLGAGNYAVIFGSGQFGATGSGGVDGSANIGTPSFIFHNGSSGPAWFNDNASPTDGRFFVEGTVAAPLPDSATACLMLLGGLTLTRFMRHRIPIRP